VSLGEKSAVRTFVDEANHFINLPQSMYGRHI
jgi:hypothetical protein